MRQLFALAEAYPDLKVERTAWRVPFCRIERKFVIFSTIWWRTALTWVKARVLLIDARQ